MKTQQEKDQALIEAAEKLFPDEMYYQAKGSAVKKDLIAFAKSDAAKQYWFNQIIKGNYTPKDLITMLEDVVTVLNPSDHLMEKHGPLGTPPSELVGLVLEQKDLQIRALKAGMKDVSDLKKESEKQYHQPEPMDVKKLHAEWHKIIDAIIPKSPNCRDCADHAGVCPNTNLPCDPTDAVIYLYSAKNAKVHELEKEIEMLKNIQTHEGIKAWINRFYEIKRENTRLQKELESMKNKADYDVEFWEWVELNCIRMLDGWYKFKDNRKNPEHTLDCWFSTEHLYTEFKNQKQ